MHALDGLNWSKRLKFRETIQNSHSLLRQSASSVEKPGREERRGGGERRTAKGSEEMKSEVSAMQRVHGASLAKP